MARKGYSAEQIIEFFSRYGYEYIDGEVGNSTDKITVKDKEGYLYYSSMMNLSKTGRIRPFDKSNPYTIKNIKTFLANNYSGTEVLETDFISNSYNMKWKCSCGNVFIRRWNNMLASKTFKCKECILNDSKFSSEEINEILKNKKLTIVEDVYKNSTTPFCVKNEEGYKAKVYIHSLKRSNSILYFSTKNPYTIENINTYLKNNNISFRIISNDYNGRTSNLLCKCCKCNKEFTRMWRDIQCNDAIGCPYCESNRFSKFARKVETLLKEKEICYELEKRFDGCKDVLKLPFDFYLPNYNICIEVQGQQHYESVPFYGGDEKFIERQRHDKIKRDYCRNNNIILIELSYLVFKDDTYKEIINKYL